VVALTPEDVTAHQKVAELLAKLGRKAQAVQAYEDVARRYTEQGLFFKASAVCRLLLELEPGHERTQELIASRYSRERRPTPAPPPTQPAPAARPSRPALPVAPAPSRPAIPLFSTLSQVELKEVLGTAMEVRVLDAGEVVVAEGAAGDSMFALVEGAASIYRGWKKPDQRRVARLAPGDIFGEAAMVSGAPRLATVVVDSDSVVLETSREAMARITARYPEVGQRLDEFYRERLMANALRASPILRGLREADHTVLMASFQPCTFPDGQHIIDEGQPADSVYLVLRGVCSASHWTGGRYPDLREGDLFGELSVLTGGLATATVVASGPVLTLRIPASEFRTRVLKEPQAMLAVKKLAESRLQRTMRLDQQDSDEQVEDRRV
jgi:cAMP-dependent protein kinase regulator